MSKPDSMLQHSQSTSSAKLMSVFTGILSGRTELDPTLLAEIQASRIRVRDLKALRYLTCRTALQAQCSLPYPRATSRKLILHKHVARLRVSDRRVAGTGKRFARHHQGRVLYSETQNRYPELSPMITMGYVRMHQLLGANLWITKLVFVINYAQPHL